MSDKRLEAAAKVVWANNGSDPNCTWAEASQAHYREIGEVVLREVDAADDHVRVPREFLQAVETHLRLTDYGKAADSVHALLHPGAGDGKA